MNRFSCECDCHTSEDRQKTPASDSSSAMTLADLPVGTTARIIKIMPGLRCMKKFADVGIVPGTEQLMEAHAPFGGLIRVKIMETSVAIHKDDAVNIMIKRDTV